MRRRIAFFGWLTLVLAQGQAVDAQQADWQELIPQINPQSGVAGEWRRTGGELSVTALEGARIELPVLPAREYDFQVEFTRKTGQNSIALIFVHGGKQATCEVDAWGEHLAGIQNISNQDIRQNATRQEAFQLVNDQRQTLKVEVRRNHVRCLLNQKEFALHRSTGADLSLSSLWELSQPNLLGVGAWNSETLFHSIKVRSLTAQPLQMTKATLPPASATPTPVKPGTLTPGTSTPATKTVRTGKHVLLVIANQDFFYREYAEPREELERAGIRVSVAAGRKSVCRPHPNSGQGNSNGEVNPDLALQDVKVQDYDAVLFSGGWGSSSYQYAFNGRYDNASYNGDRLIKTQANRIVNEFLEAQKYTCALCNAVSVLAWARVNGKSPLEGKRVCAPTREAAAGIYNGRHAQPSCRWHPEANGAILSPAGMIGRPGTAIDDVLVDGLIITGEDDISAREMGRRIVQVLTVP